MKIALLGDSIFDNERYIMDGGDSVLRAIQKMGYNCELLARDGDCIHDVYAQSEKLNKDSGLTLFLSVGGNDALFYLDLIFENIHLDIKEIKILLSDFFTGFEKDLSSLYLYLSNKYEKLPIYVCNIYYPSFDFKNRNFIFNHIKEMGYETKIFELIDILNEIILRNSGVYNFGFLDINRAFNNKKFYANEIEPSSDGSKLLAGMISDTLRNTYFNKFLRITSSKEKNNLTIDEIKREIDKLFIEFDSEEDDEMAIDYISDAEDLIIQYCIENGYAINRFPLEKRVHRYKTILNKEEINELDKYQIFLFYISLEKKDVFDILLYKYNKFYPDFEYDKNIDYFRETVEDIVNFYNNYGEKYWWLDPNVETSN